MSGHKKEINKLLAQINTKNRQTKRLKRYCFVQKPKTTKIIDGQQRLTTLQIYPY